MARAGATRAPACLSPCPVRPNAHPSGVLCCGTCVAHVALSKTPEVLGMKEPWWDGRTTGWRGELVLGGVSLVLGCPRAAQAPCAIVPMGQSLLLYVFLPEGRTTKVVCG